MKILKVLPLLPFALAIGTWAQNGYIIPQGTDIKVRTDTAIPAKPVADARYSATISNDVMNNSGALPSRAARAHNSSRCQTRTEKIQPWISVKYREWPNVRLGDLKI